MPALPEFEAGNSVQFKFITSVAPDAAPMLTVWNTTSDQPIQTLTAQQSDTTHAYGLVTMPGSKQTLVIDWVATKTFVGTPYAFVKRYLVAVVDHRPTAL